MRYPGTFSFHQLVKLVKAYVFLQFYLGMVIQSLLAQGFIHLLRDEGLFNFDGSLDLFQ
jgi:hypothetical protein